MYLNFKHSIFKSYLVLLMVVILLHGFVVSAFASEAMPAYEACSSCSMNFGISNGTAEIFIQYDAQSATFLRLDIEVKIQKRVLGVFWQRVDIGTEDNYWRASSTELQGYFLPTFPIADTGTYRAVFYIRFTGTTGVDEIEDKIEYTYS